MRYYGHSATGFTATDVRKAQRDAKKCTGIPKSACTLSANLITYGTHGEPSVRARVEHIKDFIRLWDSLDPFELPNLPNSFSFLPTNWLHWNPTRGPGREKDQFRVSL